MIKVWRSAGNEHADSERKSATKVVNLDNFEKEGDVAGKYNDWGKNGDVGKMTGDSRGR